MDGVGRGVARFHHSEGEEVNGQLFGVIVAYVLFEARAVHAVIAGLAFSVGILDDSVEKHADIVLVVPAYFSHFLLNLFKTGHCLLESALDEDAFDEFEKIED